MSTLKRITVAALLVALMTAMPFAAGAAQAARGQIVQFNRPIVVEENEVIEGDVVSIFGNVLIRGTVEGDLVGIFSPVVLQGGHVEGDAVVIFNPLTLQNGSVNGDAVSIFGGLRAQGSSVGGSAIGVMGAGLDLQQTTVQGDSVDVAGFLPGNVGGVGLLAILLAIFFVVKQVAAFIVGVIAIVLFPDRFERMAASAFDDVGKKMLVGFLLNIGIFVVIAILAVSVVGVPLVPLVFPAFILLEFTGNTTMKISLGKKISQGMGRNWGAIVELLVGTLIYLLLEITLVGKLFTFIFKLIGMGEVVDSRFGDQLPIKHQGGTTYAS